ncbi:MAG TPA: ferrochelatase [Symbiobacteriaceae bacterium]|nr:ferrochelatase [Symbiobacteriaceae bacterium]
MSKPVIGVLVMAYGTPNKKEEILPYYTDIRRGRPPTLEQLAELTQRYEAIGGLSRLNEISIAQTRGIARNLKDSGDDAAYRVYGANRHWHPFIKDVVRQMYDDGIRHAVAIVLAPQGSKMSSGAYFERLDQAVAELPEPIHFAKVFNWHLEPGFIEAEVEKVAEAAAKFPEVPREKLAVIFSCHSLPERILTWNDPYPTHLREMGEAIAARVGLKNVHFAYQSAGRTPEPWLGPEVSEKVAELAAAGEKAVLVSSVGFISDHLEVLYDLDIELKQAAERQGMHFERSGMLNDHPLLCKALADVIRRHARGA